jgi:hypothetical protein
MGLDAVVYKSAGSIAFDPVKEGARRDETTGEICFEGDVRGKEYPRSSFTAAEKRLGNILAIRALRIEVSTILQNENSTLQQKVLYNGTHAGDVIGAEGLDELEREINVVRTKAGRKCSPRLQSFLKDFQELIDASRRESNPIVFT